MRVLNLTTLPSDEGTVTINQLQISVNMTKGNAKLVLTIESIAAISALMLSAANTIPTQRFSGIDASGNR